MRNMMWYFANNECMDNIYGAGSPVCIDYEEAMRLASEWEMSIDEIMEQFHEATAEEIEMYGFQQDSASFYAK